MLSNLELRDLESSTLATGPLLNKGKEGKEKPAALEIIELSMRFYKHKSALNLKKKHLR